LPGVKWQSVTPDFTQEKIVKLGIYHAVKYPVA